MRNEVDSRLPVIVKIAPDLTDQEMVDIAGALTRKNVNLTLIYTVFFWRLFFCLKKKVDGLIVSNTTIDRPESLLSKEKKETGGLSGRPLKAVSNAALKRMYELTRGQLALIGSGGIESGQDALERIKSGATLVQIYTAMSFEGPTIVNRIKRELIEELKWIIFFDKFSLLFINFDWYFFLF